MFVSIQQVLCERIKTYSTFMVRLLIGSERRGKHLERFEEDAAESAINTNPLMWIYPGHQQHMYQKLTVNGGMKYLWLFTELVRKNLAMFKNMGGIPKQSFLSGLMHLFYGMAAPMTGIYFDQIYIYKILIILIYLNLYKIEDRLS